jgi:hypothetical protein
MRLKSNWPGICKRVEWEVEGHLSVAGDPALLAEQGVAVAVGGLESQQDGDL